MAAQKGKDRAGGENPGQVIDPVQFADGKGQNTGPVAELTAEIGSQDRDQRRQPPVFVIKYQQQEKGQVYQQGVNGVYPGRAQSQDNGIIQKSGDCARGDGCLAFQGRGRLEKDSG